MVHFPLVFDYRSNELRYYIEGNSIVFPLINNSYLKFKNRSENFIFCIFSKRSIFKNKCYMIIIFPGTNSD